MKRSTLVKHLVRTERSFFEKVANIVSMEERGATTAYTKHTEVMDKLARKICKDLDIPFVR